MITRYVEATNVGGGGVNHGKFMVGAFEAGDWARLQEVGFENVREAGGKPSLLRLRGWTAQHVLVVDLQTGEGAVFRPGGVASADVAKHRIWVCPLFEPFLEWLYLWLTTQAKLPEHTVEGLPAVVNLDDAPSALQGYRRPGP